MLSATSNNAVLSVSFKIKQSLYLTFYNITSMHPPAWTFDPFTYFPIYYYITNVIIILFIYKTNWNEYVLVCMNYSDSFP